MGGLTDANLAIFTHFGRIANTARPKCNYIRETEFIHQFYTVGRVGTLTTRSKINLGTQITLNNLGLGTEQRS